MRHVSALTFVLVSLQEINRLVAPPDTAPVRTKPRFRDRREYRRHAKFVNHDSCDSCREGGDLLCCDRCPASFHLQCQ